MTDWDEINERKRREINLGMAKNGAVLILKDSKGENWPMLYKETVRQIFQLNDELDREILKTNIYEVRE